MRPTDTAFVFSYLFTDKQVCVYHTPYFTHHTLDTILQTLCMVPITQVCVLLGVHQELAIQPGGWQRHATKGARTLQHQKHFHEERHLPRPPHTHTDTHVARCAAAGRPFVNPSQTTFLPFFPSTLSTVHELAAAGYFCNVKNRYTPIDVISPPLTLCTACCCRPLLPCKGRLYSKRGVPHPLCSAHRDLPCKRQR